MIFNGFDSLYDLIKGSLKCAQENPHTYLLLHTLKWDFIESESLLDQQMECFQNLLYKIFDISFPVISKTIFNKTEPFFTEKLIKLKRLKCRKFNKRRMATEYQSLNNIYKHELSKAKKSYYRKKS